MSRSVLALIASILVIAAVVHFATVAALPHVVMQLVRWRFTAYGPPNQFFHVPPVTAELRDVVMPSPDLLYSVCVFDLSRRALKITAQVPKTYWSLAMFASNTDNFFAINDQQAGDGHSEVLLVGPGTEPPQAFAGPVVRSPSTTGVIMVRILVPDSALLPELIAMQQAARCLT